MREQAARDPIRLARETARPELPKRFYERAEARESEGRFGVLLDGRPIRTPGRAQLVLPTRAAAEATAAEWAAQGAVIDPATMPLTRMVNVALDGVAAQAAAVRDDIVNFAGTDLVCYRADTPEGLVTLQARHWDPVVQWAEKALGARFVLACGVMPADQSEAALTAVRSAVETVEPLRLTALHVMTGLTGSALIALAVLRGRLDVGEAWRAAHVDEDWNIAQWGEDAEAARRRAARFEDMKAAATLITLVGAESGWSGTDPSQ